MRTAALLKQPIPAIAVRGDDYARLDEIERAAHALELSIIVYRAIPAFPINETYRQSRLERVERDIADMRKALCDG